jgi:hypothetical protein
VATSFRQTASLVAVLAAASLASCLPGSSVQNPFAAAARGPTRVHVRVENLNFNDATIYARRGGEVIRLGDVRGKTHGEFWLDWNIPLPMDFRADLVGNGSCDVRPLHVDPGDEVWVRIPTQLGITPCESHKRRSGGSP